MIIYVIVMLIYAITWKKIFLKILNNYIKFYDKLCKCRRKKLKWIFLIYVNIAERQTDRQTHQKYSSEPHKTHVKANFQKVPFSK